MSRKKSDFNDLIKKALAKEPDQLCLYLERTSYLKALEREALVKFIRQIAPRKRGRPKATKRSDSAPFKKAQRIISGRAQRRRSKWLNENPQRKYCPRRLQIEWLKEAIAHYVVGNPEVAKHFKDLDTSANDLWHGEMKTTHYQHIRPKEKNPRE